MRKSTIDAPVLIKRPTNNNEITLQEGNLLKIKCQADGNPIPKIDWYLNGTKIDKSTYKDIQIEIKGNLSTLIIGKVGTRHEGNFSCIAHNNNGLLSKWAYVSVMKNYKMDTTIRSSTSVYFCSQETCVYGSCIRENNTSFCRCLPPYSGIRCEYQPPEKVNFTEPCITFQNNKDHSFTENKLFALISFSLLLVLVLLLIILLCFYKFRKRRSYIHGIKAKKLKNAATQVSDIFYSDLNISQIPDNISSSILNTEKSFLSSCVYNEAPPYNSLVIQKDSRGPPSGQSCSSQDTSLTNTVVIPKSILLSVNDNSYSLYNSSTMNNNYCHTQLPPQMIRLENTSPYLCPALETETNLSLNNYIGNIISLPFSCNDPCCCLNVDSKNLLTPTLQNNVSKPSLISIHSNPMESDHICTCKCNIQSINTFV